jgi:hypothetical protein
MQKVALTDKPQTFRFKVSLTPKIYRTIDINGNEDLYEFASTIVNAFDFDLDHAFGFYNTTSEYYHDADESYELFIDEGLQSVTGGTHCYGVAKQLIKNAFHPGKQMLFLFDYGDEWRFKVECLSTSSERAYKMASRVIENLSKGEAPQQYPDYDEA